MKARKEECNPTEKRLLGVKDLCTFLSMGRDRSIEFAKAAGAERKVGRRCLYDRKVLERALDDENNFIQTVGKMKED